MESAKTEKVYKVNKTQAKFFWKRFAFWCDFWGIDKLWEIHTKELKDDNCYASVGASFNDGLAVVKFVTEWDVLPTKKQIDKVAFHESAHLFLFPVTDHDSCTIGNEHQIVRVLENQVWSRISEYGIQT